MKISFINLLLVISINILGQQNLSHDDTSLIGTWKGTSICQIRLSACNDEIAVYHITKSDRPNTYHIVMNKIVNEKEEDMAVYDYSFDTGKQTLTCVDDKHNIKWNFTIKAGKMEGTLVSLTDQNKVYRIIKLSKAKN